MKHWRMVVWEVLDDDDLMRIDMTIGVGVALASVGQKTLVSGAPYLRCWFCGDDDTHLVSPALFLCCWDDVLVYTCPG
jgi:hypothetical protein